MNLSDWSAVAALALFWGVSFFFVELAIPSFQPFTLVFIRVFIACALMLFIIRRRRPFAVIVGRWRVYSLMGLLGSGLPFVCFAWGQRYIDSGAASVINALTPIFVLALAILIGREKYNLFRVGGIVLSFVGVIVLMDPNMAASEGWGMAAALVAALSYGIATNIAWGRISHYPPTENACGHLFFASLYTLPFMLWEQPWRDEITLVPLLAVIGLAVLSTFFAYLLYYRLLGSAGGVNAMLAVLLMPIISITFGVIFLDERFGGAFFAGTALVLVGVSLTDEKMRRMLASFRG